MKNKKLIQVNRYIEIRDLESKTTLAKEDISHISLDSLLQIFKPYERGDPYLYDPYDICEIQLAKLNKYLKTPLIYNSKLDYTLAAFGVYLDTITGEIIK